MPGYQWLTARFWWRPADFSIIRRQILSDDGTPGASANDQLLGAFEQRHQRLLPTDVKSNYAIMNGSRDYTEEQHGWMRFWPIDDWRPAPQQFPDDSVASALPRHMFVCADYAYECVYFVIDLDAASATYGAVYGLGATRAGLAATSFSEFVDRVANNSDALHSYA